MIIVDIETTGLGHDDDVIEIGAIRVNTKLQVIDTFQTFAKPNKPISEFISGLTGIVDEDVADAPSPIEATNAFFAWAGDDELYAYNSPFDFRFLNRFGANATHNDILPMAREAFPDFKNHKLQTVLKNLGIAVETAHRAVDDCKGTLEIFKAIVSAKPRTLKMTSTPTVEDQFFYDLIVKNGQVTQSDVAPCDSLTRNIFEQFFAPHSPMKVLKVYGLDEAGQFSAIPVVAQTHTMRENAIVRKEAFLCA